MKYHISSEIKKRLGSALFCVLFTFLLLIGAATAPGCSSENTIHPDNTDSSGLTNNQTTLSDVADTDKQAIIAAREVGIQLLSSLAPDEELKSSTTPYIL